VKTLLLLLSLLLAAPAAAVAGDQGYVTTEDGVRLFYRIEGQGSETLVVVHGGPGNSLESVRLHLAPLARHRRVIYYDQRGNGQSDLIDRPERLAVSLHIADLDAIRRHFHLERMNLLGNSWGGLLAAAYAEAHPDRVARLILHAPAPPTAAYLRAMQERSTARAAERLTPEQRRRAVTVGDPRAWLAADDPLPICRDFMAMVFRLYVFDPAVPVDFRGDVCAGPVAAVRRQMAVNGAIWSDLGDFDLRPGARRVTAPVLVIHGAADVIPLEGSRDWANSFPNGRLLIIERAGHLVHLEQPQVFFPAVEAFLAGRD
jgi:proline iminopeptidase